MDEAQAFPDSELRAPAKLVAGLFVVAAFALYYVGDNGLNAARVPMLDTALVCLGVAAAVLLLERWLPRISSLVAVLGLSGLLVLCDVWLNAASAVTMLCLATLLAAALLGLWGAVAVAAFQSIGLVLARSYLSLNASPEAGAVALAGVWVAVAVAVIIYRPVYERSAALRIIYTRAQGALDDARSRQLEMEQALAQGANANRQLALANERIAALRLIAEDAQKTKTTFVAKVSHEFRTPLNMIIGLVQLIAEKPEIYALDPSPELEEALEVVLRNCRHLANLITDVLDLTRVETGRLTLHKERVDLGEIVHEAVAAVRPLVDSKRLALEVIVPAGLPEVSCDRTRIRQVVLNLVSNAARFTEHGGLTIRVVRRDSALVVEVADTGPGIPAEDAERIFEPFCQGADAIWRDKGGSGLGLSISQQFVKLHQGRLWLESELGVGSSFFFELPISPPVERAPGADRWLRSDWLWREGAFRTERVAQTELLPRPRVVLWDEAGTLAPEFARYEPEIELVRSAGLAEAFEAARLLMANVVVLNTAQPEQLALRLAATRREAPGVPVVGCSVPDSGQSARSAGAAGYLVKPVSRADLARVLSGTRAPVRRVLVVDDDPDALALFSRMLHVVDGQLEVDTAADGTEAVDKLSRKPYDLVLLDIVMPGIDGWGVLQRLRADGATALPPIYLVSAQDPADRPPASEVLVASVGEGLSIVKLLRCSLELATLLLTPDGVLDPTPPRPPAARPA